MINVPRILRDKSLISLVNFCNIKEPSVVYIILCMIFLVKFLIIIIL